MSQITVEDRVRKFLRDKERLNHQLQAGEITAETYAERIEEMRQVNTGPMPLANIVENIEYHANCMRTALFNAGMAKDHKTQLRRLETTLQESLANLGGLLEDVRTLMTYEAPHILLELDVHPCLTCILFNQLEPMNHKEACEGCGDIDARQSWEADKHPYYDGLEAGGAVE